MREARSPYDYRPPARVLVGTDCGASDRSIKVTQTEGCGLSLHQSSSPSPLDCPCQPVSYPAAGQPGRLPGGRLGLEHRSGRIIVQAQPVGSAPQVNNASRYTKVVLGSFRDKDAERIWRRQRSHRLDSVRQRAALRKLLVMDAAEELDDLRVPPGNHLERLYGGLAGRYSIRINDQWRICFRWTTSGPEEVEIVDYH